MNSREKFNSVLSFDSISNIPKVEFGYWAGTLRNWLKQGMPKLAEIPNNLLEGDLVRGSSTLVHGRGELVDVNVRPYFNLDYYLAKFPFDISPMLEEKIIEENGTHRIFKDNYGITQKVTKIRAATPMPLEFPITDRNSFENYISLYDRKDFSKRLPENFDDLAKKLKNRDFPIRLGGNPFGFSFLARHLMGEKKFMLSLYDDPKLIKDFNQFFVDFVMDYWAKILEKVKVDCIIILEDVAYRSGSFISKEFFEKFMAPYYIKFTDYLKQFGIKNIVVDSDGLIEELIPLWIKSGVTGIFPIEAVNDIEEIREKYPKLQLIGGINKKVLFKDSSKERIDRELDMVLRLLKKGGYIPHVDHAVSADCTWENFKYYRKKLNKIIDNL